MSSDIEKSFEKVSGYYPDEVVLRVKNLIYNQNTNTVICLSNVQMKNCPKNVEKCKQICNENVFTKL